MFHEKEDKKTSKKPLDTSWQKATNWYDALVGTEGHHYHKNVILPNALKLLTLDVHSHLLDLGCGQGVLSRCMPKDAHYTGVDLSSKLIKLAKEQAPKNVKTAFYCHDVTLPLEIAHKGSFTHAAFILSLQNMQDQEKAIQNASAYLKPSGKLLIVLNHPAFRIPRQTSWGFDEQTKIQYRKLNSYLSSQKIPIHMHPGKTPSEKNHDDVTWSFHYPISAYAAFLKKSGFLIEALDEWCSDKESSGGASKWENRARKEFPLFLAILAVKNSSVS